MKRFAAIVLALLMLLCILASGEEEKNEEKKGGLWGWISGAASDVGDWVSGAADDVGGWVEGAAEDAWNWTSGAATDAWKWTSGAATDAWNWTTGAATDTWNGITGFFAPPETTGNPNIAPEPELPAGTPKLYLGYQVIKTGLNNGYSGEKTIGRDDPHFGLTVGKFYVSDFTSALGDENGNFTFLKTVGDNVQLHFELVQDIDMLGGDTFVTINADDGGYDKYFGIKPTYFGRGTLIVRHTDYQNNAGEPQIYTDYLAAKMTGEADTVIQLSEEGDYEVALDYEIRKDHYVLGVKITSSEYYNYRLFFRFSVRNGNCMVFPFDAVTKGELTNSAVTPNGFYLDLAYSRYLDIMVKRSQVVEQNGKLVEDVRFNRPARDGETYTQEGIYTITVKNRYTGEETVKMLYVGVDERMMKYVEQGLSVDEIIQALGK